MPHSELPYNHLHPDLWLLLFRSLLQYSGLSSNGRCSQVHARLHTLVTWPLVGASIVLKLLVLLLVQLLCLKVVHLGSCFWHFRLGQYINEAYGYSVPLWLYAYFYHLVQQSIHIRSYLRDVCVSTGSCFHHYFSPKEKLFPLVSKLHCFLVSTIVTP